MAESRMRESLLRSFFTLFYERLGPLILGAVLRALPWTLIALLLTFLSPTSLGGRYTWLLGGIALLAFLVAPVMTEAVYLYCADLARAVEPRRPHWNAGLGSRSIRYILCRHTSG